jgi:hypothetical protein
MRQRESRFGCEGGCKNRRYDADTGILIGAFLAENSVFNRARPAIRWFARRE